jgi:hypothetical protein
MYAILDNRSQRLCEIQKYASRTSREIVASINVTLWCFVELAFDASSQCFNSSISSRAASSWLASNSTNKFLSSYHRLTDGHYLRQATNQFNDTRRYNFLLVVILIVTMQNNTTISLLIIPYVLSSYTNMYK